MSINVTGPDGSTFEFPDGMDSTAIDGAMRQHYSAPAREGFDRNDPRLQEQTSAAALRGVPILGAGVNKAGAAISALAQPLTGVGSEGASIGDRYAKNLAQEDAAQAAFEKEHPVADTVSKGIGGTLALGGLGAASAPVATALGMTGRMLPAMTNAALSGTAIGMLDAGARGEDPTKGGVVGALTGAGGVLGGKIIGKGYDAARNLVRGKQPPVPQNILPVNGVDVPVSESTLTRNPATAAQEQIAARGVAGDPAQAIATRANEGTARAMQEAEDRFAAGLDPSGTSPRATPQEAAGDVGAELVAQEQRRAAAEVARIRGGEQDLAGVSRSLEAPVPAADRQGIPNAPFEGAAATQAAVQRAAQEAAAARTAAYDAQAVLPGEFSPAMFTRAGNAIRNRLGTGRDAVRVSDRVTPNTAEGLQVIDEQLGQLRFENQTRRGDMVIGPDGRPQNPPITPSDVEQVRKQLVILRRQANSAARQPGGSAEDARGVSRLMDEFDDHVRRGVEAGGFSGDGPAYLAGADRARGLHAQFRQNFSKTGPADRVGATVEDIIGRNGGTPMDPGRLMQTLIGAADNPGSGLAHATAVVQRLRNVIGENTPDWAAFRKGVLAHLTQAEPGAAAIAHDVQADRVMSLLNSPKSRLLSQALFSPAERQNLARYAANVRGSIDAPPETTAQKIVAKLSGRTGGAPASSTEVVNQLFDLTANKETSVQLARELRNSLSWESWARVKQGMWTRLTEKAEGAIQPGAQKVSEQLHKFLSSQLAHEIYTTEERQLMKVIADAHSALIPVPGSTNPSGTAPMLTKAMKGMSNQLLTLFGFAHGGLPGAALGIGAGKALSWAGNRRAASQATKLFYGAQPAPPRSTGAQQFGALVGPASLVASERSR